MRLRVKQDSVHKGRDWWDWSVWLDASAATLDQVESVKYLLHPSFPNPVRVMRNRSEQFRLDTSGWGEFELRMEIRKKDGTIDKRSHWVRLEGPKRTGEYPVLFLSHAASDAPIATTLRKALESRKVVVIEAAETEFEGDLYGYFGTPLLIDAVVAVFSDAPSISVNNEVRMARELRLPVFPVCSANATLPPLLRNQEAFSLRTSGDAQQIAEEVAKRLSADRDQ